MAGSGSMPANTGQGSATRDIQSDIVVGLSEDTFPSLKSFFEVLQGPVMRDESILQALAGAQNNPVVNGLLGIMEDVVTTQNNRYNTLAARAAGAADKGQNELAKYKEALTKTRAERDTLKEVIHSRGGDGGSAAADRDSAMPHPTAFTGDEKDTAKRTSQEFDSEGKKILYAAALLEGTAAGGVFAGIEKITSNPTNPAAWRWKTADEFMTHLARKYATLDLAADAKNKIRTLAQKDDFAAFTDFLTEFTNLTDICEWDDAARVRGFREKLSRRMREALNMQVTTPARNDFPGWVKMAQALAVNLEGEDYLRKAGNSSNNGNRYTNGGSKPRDPDAMDVDTMRVNLAKIPEEDICIAQAQEAL
ncbi:hypothetical protein C8A05DRAFT_39307 [Staphylotrichum tortipilum]|uniref:Uncharacterized protein n=1 Tax=Staphylotrichum tortipilum TaxID=2831512 RepID=A0AAN6MBU2_9PEZI|nr:hypothetical protein C8A05DRAFT_39307 [Staphylotrichum longicolle]